MCVKMIRKDGKTVSSIPISINWPGVTFPAHHVFINGCEQLIICWGDSNSINDGNIESYIVCFVFLFEIFQQKIFFLLLNSFIYMILKIVY